MSDAHDGIAGNTYNSLALIVENAADNPSALKDAYATALRLHGLAYERGLHGLADWASGYLAVASSSTVEPDIQGYAQQHSGIVAQTLAEHRQEGRRVIIAMARRVVGDAAVMGLLGTKSDEASWIASSRPSTGLPNDVLSAADRELLAKAFAYPLSTPLLTETSSKLLPWSKTIRQTKHMLSRSWQGRVSALAWAACDMVVLLESTHPHRFGLPYYTGPGLKNKIDSLGHYVSAPEVATVIAATADWSVLDYYLNDAVRPNMKPPNSSIAPTHVATAAIQAAWDWQIIRDARKALDPDEASDARTILRLRGSSNLTGGNTARKSAIVARILGNE